jgi:hypothetical protein
MATWYITSVDGFRSWAGPGYQREEASPTEDGVAIWVNLCWLLQSETVRVFAFFRAARITLAAWVTTCWSTH